MPVFLTNPKGKRKRSTSTTMKRKMARVRSFIKNKKGGKTVAKKRRKKTKTVTVYRKRTVSRANPPRKRAKARKRYRRNFVMPKTAVGFGTVLMNGVIDTSQVVLGKVAAKTLPPMIGIPSGGPMGLLIQAAVALSIGFLGTTMISKNAGKMMLAGALASPVEDMIKQMNIPFISPALGENDAVLIEDVGSYPNRLSSYPQSMGEEYAVGEEEEEVILNQM